MIQTDLAIEINITRHCNNRCAGCNHASPFVVPYYMSPEVLRRDLALLKPLLHVGPLMLQGGEPLLHPDIIALLQIIADAEVSQYCGVLTNGRLLPRMPEVFWQTLGDRHMQLRISVYPNLPADVVPLAQEKARYYGFSLQPTAIPTFNPIFRLNDGSSYGHCPWKRCLTVHEGYFYLCPLSAFFPSQFMRLPVTTDGIPLEGLSEPVLREFLNRLEPLESCHICTGTSAPEVIPWHQANTREEWLRSATAK